MDAATDIQIYSAVVPADSALRNVDVVFHEGQFWLVPIWTQSPDGKFRAPERAIALDLLPHDRMAGRIPEFVVHEPIPMAFFSNPPVTPQGKENQIRVRPPWIAVLASHFGNA